MVISCQKLACFRHHTIFTLTKRNSFFVGYVISNFVVWHWISKIFIFSFILLLSFHSFFFFDCKIYLSFVGHWFLSFFLSCPVGWGCKIHRQRLTWVSWIWHLTIWWWGFWNNGTLGNAEHPFIAIAPRSTLTLSGSTWYSPIYGLNRTNSILMMNGIV